MGSKLISSCVERQEQQNLLISSKRAKHNVKIVQDFYQINQDSWFRFQNKLLFDPNKFIFLYPNYRDQQQSLMLKWKYLDIKNQSFVRNQNLNQVLSPKWKFAIRKGVPIKHYKTLISVIFNRNFEIGDIKKDYAFLSNQILNADGFKKQKKTGLLFGSQGALNQIAHAEFLNNQGLLALSNILWILQKKKDNLVYNKYIAHVGALLLIFLQQQQAYYILSIILQNSLNMPKNKVQSLRWHFTYTYNQMQRFAQNFFQIAKLKSENVQRLINNCKRLRIPLTQIFIEVIQNFFYGFFSFPVILKIFLIYLNEGVKVFYRIFFGILSLSAQSLYSIQQKNKMLSTLRNKCLKLDPQEIKYLLKISFTTDLKNLKLDIAGSDEEYQNQRCIYTFYTPQVQGQSQIISLDHLNSIWQFLPYYLKSYDAKRVFVKEGSLNLSNMISSVEFGNSGLIIIQTLQNDIFGVYLCEWIKKNADADFYGNSQNFVFELQPQKHRYKSTGQNINFMNLCQKYLSIGDGNEGPALQISFDLSNGSTHRSATYGNQHLNSRQQTEFTILRLEVYTFF